MNIQVRDIYAKKDHRFDDTGIIDTKAARNCLVALISSDNHIYYLTLATHNKNVMDVYQKYPDKNYMLTKKKVEGLAETSLVNLESIYKDDINGRLVVVVPSGEYDKLVKKFKIWQEQHPHPLYSEVKPLLEQI